MKLPSSYYSRPLAPEWRLVVLDTTDLCTGSGWPEVEPGPGGGGTALAVAFGGSLWW